MLSLGHQFCQWISLLFLTGHFVELERTLRPEHLHHLGSYVDMLESCLVPGVLCKLYGRLTIDLEDEWSIHFHV